MSREAMKLALEALEEINKLSIGENAICLPAEIDGAMDALRERLAQPEMEPCAGRNCGSTNPNLHSAECFEDYEKATGMRAWHGLTDEDIDDCEIEVGMPQYEISSADLYAFARVIEAKLREKNT